MPARSSPILGPAFVGTAVAVALALGPFGFLVIGFGAGTDCDTWYADAGDNGACRGVTVAAYAQAAGQLAIVVLGAAALLRRHASVILGLVLATASVGSFVAAVDVSAASYCRPGTEGYAESYCPGAPGRSTSASPPGSGSASPRA